MAARRRADPEVEALDDSTGGGASAGGGAVPDLDVEAELAELEATLGEVGEDEPSEDAESAGGDEPDADATGGAVDPVLGTPYTADDAAYGQFTPDPAERQPGAAPYEFEHDHTIDADGFTDRGAELYLRAVGYNWPKSGKPVMLADGDLYTEVGDAYPLLPALRGENNL